MRERGWRDSDVDVSKSKYDMNGRRLSPFDIRENLKREFSVI